MLAFLAASRLIFASDKILVSFADLVDSESLLSRLVASLLLTFIVFSTVNKAVPVTVFLLFCFTLMVRSFSACKKISSLSFLSSNRSSLAVLALPFGVVLVLMPDCVAAL